MTHTVSRISVYNGGGAESLAQSDYINARVLGTNTVESFQAPIGARRVLFSGDGAFYCRITPAVVGSALAAAIPAVDVTDGSASELNPGMRELPGSQAYISLIASVATVVTLQYFG